MKKKYFPTNKDKQDWSFFTKHMGNIRAKEEDLSSKKKYIEKTPKLDLHGFSLVEANQIVKKYIIESYSIGYKKIIIITGKGLRSKSHNNPYVSEKLSMLKYSIPEYIKNNESLRSKINRISDADLKNGGEGAICVFLKSNKNL